MGSLKEVFSRPSTPTSGGSPPVSEAVLQMLAQGRILAATGELRLEKGAEPVLEVGLLGPLRVRHDGVRVDIRGVRERAVLSALALRAPRCVGSDDLVEAAWGEDVGADPANKLQVTVSRLRRQLGGARAAVMTCGSGYALAVDPAHVDAAAFEQAMSAVARIGTGPRSLQLLTDALALWAGAALEDVETEGWLTSASVRLDDLRLTAIEERNDSLLETGSGRELIPELEALIVEHPLREGLRGQLMKALHQAGRRAEALQLYEDSRRLLADRLGVDPSSPLRDLHTAILRGDPSLEAPIRHHLEVRLPVRLTSFIGREDELRELGGLVASQRLVTVVGPGGVGKTSLAVEAARRHARHHPTAVWFVDFAPVRDPERLQAAIMTALGIRTDGPGATDVAPVDAIVAFLRERQTLLVLDNCEQVAEPVARLVDSLLRSCLDLSLLATSRAVLGVDGEVVWGTPPLQLPGAEDLPTREGEAPLGDAVALFLDRARTADARFVLDPADRRHVEDICRRLDGLPLGIELAAARVRALSVEEVAARLGDRFRLLDGGARTAVPRQQTLRAAIDWSYELLSGEEAELFQRLAVFVSPWRMADAETVCADEVIPAGRVVGLVTQLVDRSLVAPVQGGRFRLLETMRSYVHTIRHPSVDADLRHRHAAYFLSVAESLPDQPADRGLLHTVEACLTDIDAAIDWALEQGDTKVALRFAGALGWFWATFHNAEGMRRIERILGTASTQPSPALGRALQAAAYLDSYMPTATTRQRALASVEMLDRCGDRRGAARSRLIAAFIEMMQAGDMDAAQDLVDRADEAARAMGDGWTEALVSLTRFRFLLHGGDVAAALEHGAEALARFTALDDPWGMPWTAVWLAVARRTSGKLEDARVLLEDTIPTVPAGSYVASLAMQELGNILALQGEHEAAAGRHGQALDVAVRSAVRILVGFAHNAAGFGARARGDAADARQHYGGALRVFRDLDHDDGIACSRCGLGLAELDLGQRDAAERELRDAAASALRTGRPDVLAAVLEGLALLRAATQPLEAARLLGAASRHREGHGLRCGAVELAEAACAAETVRARLGEDAYAAAFTAGAGLTPEQILAEPTVGRRR